MLKSTVGVLASVGLLLGASVGAGAAPATKASTFKGEIASVDAANHSFVVKATGKGEASEMSFAVDKATSIYIEGQRVLLGQLKKGEPVTVTYRMVDGKSVATSVHHHHKKKAV